MCLLGSVMPASAHLTIILPLSSQQYCIPNASAYKSIMRTETNHRQPLYADLPRPVEDLEDTRLGFKARMFPLLGVILGLGSILWTYHVARSKTPPDVKKFPWTDITHTAIRYPEYVIFRIGMMVSPVLLAITFQILKNFLQIKSFEIVGREEKRVKKFGHLAVLSCLMLCLSTATISDGGDMNWTVHTIGATSFFLIALYIIVVASAVYRDLYVVSQFVPSWSYQFKKYTNIIIGVLIALQVGQMLQIIDWGSFVQWAAAFVIMGYFFTLYWDFADMNIMLVRK